MIEADALIYAPIRYEIGTKGGLYDGGVNMQRLPPQLVLRFTPPLPLGLPAVPLAEPTHAQLEGVRQCIPVGGHICHHRVAQLGEAAGTYSY
jgi:hypothetical protein